MSSAILLVIIVVSSPIFSISNTINPFHRLAAKSSEDAKQSRGETRFSWGNRFHRMNFGNNVKTIWDNIDEQDISLGNIEKLIPRNLQNKNINRQVEAENVTETSTTTSSLPTSEESMELVQSSQFPTPEPTSQGDENTTEGSGRRSTQSSVQSSAQSSVQSSAQSIAQSSTKSSAQSSAQSSVHSITKSSTKSSSVFPVTDSSSFALKENVTEGAPGSLAVMEPVKIHETPALAVVQHVNIATLTTWNITESSQVHKNSEKCTRNQCSFFSRCEEINDDINCYCFPCSERKFSFCGSDGNTYPSLCELRRASCLYSQFIQPIHYGFCHQPLFLLTSSNKCEPACLSHQFCAININQVAARCVCKTICPDLFAPVCGTDGVTYPNECSLGVEVCMSGKPIFVAHEGPCLLGEVYVITTDSSTIVNGTCTVVQSCPDGFPCTPSIICE